MPTLKDRVTDLEYMLEKITSELKHIRLQNQNQNDQELSYDNKPILKTNTITLRRRAAC